AGGHGADLHPAVGSRAVGRHPEAGLGGGRRLGAGGRLERCRHLDRLAGSREGQCHLVAGQLGPDAAPTMPADVAASPPTLSTRSPSLTPASSAGESGATASTTG